MQIEIGRPYHRTWRYRQENTPKPKSLYLQIYDDYFYETYRIRRQWNLPMLASDMIF